MNTRKKAIKKKDFQEDLKEVLLLREKVSKDLDVASDILLTYYKQKRNRTIRNLSIVVSAVAVLTICVWSLGPSLVKMDASQQFTEAYSRFDPDVFTRDLDKKSELEMAIIAYKLGENDRALSIFNQEFPDSAKNQTFAFYKSLVLLEAGKYGESKDILNILKQKTDFMPAEVYWYLALIELKEENYRASRAYLKKMKQIDSEVHAHGYAKLYRKIRFRK
ncbi:MAG: hypothetical protein KAH17_04065 [Bacteroidales bacterium]|nr:hypothetical protein [Bacteroidales bacterium]